MYDQSIVDKIRAANESNEVGIELLIQYCMDNDIQFTSYIMFIQQFCIPLKYEYVVRKCHHCVISNIPSDILIMINISLWGKIWKLY
ncbi:hypothetical protein LNA01_23560 [Companilactobacillus nantensis]|nr:hypothetical protein LNA01_23560 [Companilactobacillus nantensis]